MNTEEKQYICVCGRTFKSKQALVGHYANCQIHKEDLKQRQIKVQLEKESKRLPNGMFKCENPECGKEHDGSYASGRFCCKSCHSSFAGKHALNRSKGFGQYSTRSEYGRWKCERCNLIFDTRAKLVEHNHQFHPSGNYQAWNKGLTKYDDIRIANGALKISETLKNGYVNGTIVSPAQTSEFWTKERREIQRQRAVERKIGGYHKHGGKGHRGWYKGYWCDSSWELAYVIYNIEHNIEFKRNTKSFQYTFNEKIYKYYPDFILSDGTYVEIKGWYDDKTIEKHKTFRSYGYTLIVIDKYTIDKYLNYVFQKYGKDFIRLYESTV